MRKLRQSKSSTKEVPIVLLTNFGQEDIIKEAFKIGADGYLLKAQLSPKDVVNEIQAFF